eukprot:6175081-Pleurochrysis_carterae.AAC.4
MPRLVASFVSMRPPFRPEADSGWQSRRSCGVCFQGESLGDGESAILTEHFRIDCGEGNSHCGISGRGRFSQASPLRAPTVPDAESTRTGCRKKASHTLCSKSAASAGSSRMTLLFVRYVAVLMACRTSSGVVLVLIPQSEWRCERIARAAAWPMRSSFRDAVKSQPTSEA